MHVVLLTKAWPFWPGEQFLTPEIDHWLRSGVDLTVLPLHAAGDRRLVPRGVTVDLRLASVSGTSRRLAAARAAASPMLLAEGRRIAAAGKANPAVVKNAATTLREALIVRDALRSLARGRRVDVAYSYWFDTQALGALLAGVAPVVSRAHGYDLYEQRAVGGYAVFKRWAGPRLDLLAPISRRGCDYASQVYEVPADRVRFSPLGVELTDSLTTPGGDGSVHLVTVGSLTAVKRPELTARAVVALASDHPEWRVRWRHAGDGPLRGAVEDIVADAPAKLSVTLAGQVPPEAMGAFLTSEPADLLVNTSSSEGVPVSIMEAMARGIPAVATDVGSTHELVVPGAGRLVPTSVTPESLARAIGTYLDLARSDDVRDRCRRVIAEHWQADANHEAFVAAVVERFGG